MTQPDQHHPASRPCTCTQRRPPPQRRATWLLCPPQMPTRLPRGTTRCRPSFGGAASTCGDRERHKVLDCRAVAGLACDAQVLVCTGCAQRLRGVVQRLRVFLVAELLDGVHEDVVEDAIGAENHCAGGGGGGARTALPWVEARVCGAHPCLPGALASVAAAPSEGGRPCPCPAEAGN